MSDSTAVEKQLHSHEIQCEKRYGEIHSRLGQLELVAAGVKRTIWILVSIVMAFELNAMLKLVGH